MNSPEMIILIDAMSCHDEPDESKCCGECQGGKDPHGMDPHQPGAKLDAGKPDMSLLIDFSAALKEVAKVGDFGAKKYTRGGWLQVPNGYTRYTAAMMRHTLTSSPIDAESNLLHAAHAAWCALARLELLLIELGEDQG